MRTNLRAGLAAALLTVAGAAAVQLSSAAPASALDNGLERLERLRLQRQRRARRADRAGDRQLGAARCRVQLRQHRRLLGAAGPGREREPCAKPDEVS